MASVNYILCSLLLVGFIQKGTADCPNGFYRHDDSCYKFFSTVRASWAEAMMYCKLFQSNLAIIETEREQNFIEGYLRSEYRSGLPNGVWIAGTDALVEGEWMWMNYGQVTMISGQTYKKWWPGEPNSLGHGEDCMDLFHHEDYNWNDDDCNKANNFLCEMSANGDIGGEIIG